MISKSSVVLGLFSKNEATVDTALDLIIQEHKNRILEKIYNNESEINLSKNAYYVISKSDYETIQEVLLKYNKFQKFQKGRTRVNIPLLEIQELKYQGLSNRQIADKFNVSEGTIRNRLKKGKSIINFKRILQDVRK